MKTTLLKRLLNAQTTDRLGDIYEQQVGEKRLTRTRLLAFLQAHFKRYPLDIMIEFPAYFYGVYGLTLARN